jgi:glycine cleavage system H protein
MKRKGKKRCPFLEVIEMAYCREAAIKKPIPLKALSPSPCILPSFSSCPFFKEAMERMYFDEIEGFKFQKTYLYHPSHLWFKKEKEGYLIGLDDFAVKIIAPVRKVHLPKAGMRVEEGGELISITSGYDKKASIMAPFSGIVKKKNKRLEKKPQLIEESPYEEGWLLHFIPEEEKGLFSSGLGEWIRKEWEEVRSIAGEKSLMTLPDGGRIKLCLSETLTKDEWEKITGLIFKKERR